MFKTPKVCIECNRYNSGDNKCIDGKINPQNKQTTIKVAGAFGSEYICDKNKWIEELRKSYGKSEDV